MVAVRQNVIQFANRVNIIWHGRFSSGHEPPQQIDLELSLLDERLGGLSQRSTGGADYELACRNAVWWCKSPGSDTSVELSAGSDSAITSSATTTTPTGNRSLVMRWCLFSTRGLSTRGKNPSQAVHACQISICPPQVNDCLLNSSWWQFYL